MLARSWGSCRTITTLIERTRNAEVRTRNRGGGFERRSRALDWPGSSAFRVPPSAFPLSSDQLQHSHPLRILPVAAQVNPPVAAAPDELPRPAQAARQHFVDDEVEADLPADVGALPLRPGERERDAIPLRRAAPRAPDRFGRAGGVSCAVHPQPAAVLSLGDHEESLHRSGLRVSGVELQPVRVDVVRLVVEPEWRGVGLTEAKLELGHIDREIQGRVVPSRVRHRGEIVGPAIWLLIASILVIKLEPQGLALVYAV